MKTLKMILLALAMISSSQLIASDCSVAYAHMKNGKFKLAYSEYRELAERGYPVYMNIIGDMHLNGQGVPKNKTLAHVWYSLSAAQNNDKGITGKKKLTQELSNEQLAESRILTKKYAQSYLEPYIASWSLDQ